MSADLFFHRARQSCVVREPSNEWSLGRKMCHCEKVRWALTPSNRNAMFVVSAQIALIFFLVKPFITIRCTASLHRRLLEVVRLQVPLYYTCILVPSSSNVLPPSSFSGRFRWQRQPNLRGRKDWPLPFPKKEIRHVLELRIHFAKSSRRTGKLFHLRGCEYDLLEHTLPNEASFTKGGPV